MDFPAWGDWPEMAPPYDFVLQQMLYAKLLTNSQRALKLKPLEIPLRK
jgi:hypothetical protein